jgi:hypothetical protein
MLVQDTQVVEKNYHHIRALRVDFYFYFFFLPPPFFFVGEGAEDWDLSLAALLIVGL